MINLRPDIIFGYIDRMITKTMAPLNAITISGINGDYI